MEADPAVRPSCDTPLLPGCLGPHLILAEPRQASTDDGKCPEHEEEAWESTGGLRRAEVSVLILEAHVGAFQSLLDVPDPARQGCGPLARSGQRLPASVLVVFISWQADATRFPPLRPGCHCTWLYSHANAWSPSAERLVCRKALHEYSDRSGKRTYTRTVIGRSGGWAPDGTQGPLAEAPASPLFLATGFHLCTQADHGLVLGG